MCYGNSFFPKDDQKPFLSGFVYTSAAAIIAKSIFKHGPQWQKCKHSSVKSFLILFHLSNKLVTTQEPRICFKHGPRGRWNKDLMQHAVSSWFGFGQCSIWCTSAWAATLWQRQWSPTPAVGANLVSRMIRQRERKQLTHHSSLIFLLSFKRPNKFYGVEYHLLWFRDQQAPFSHVWSLLSLLNPGKYHMTKLKEIERLLQKTWVGLQANGHPNRTGYNANILVFHSETSGWDRWAVLHSKAVWEQHTTQVSCSGCSSRGGTLLGRSTELQEC